MANKALFATQRGVKRTDTVNQAGGRAYKLEVTVRPLHSWP